MQNMYKNINEINLQYINYSIVYTDETKISNTNNENSNEFVKVIDIQNHWLDEIMVTK